MMAAALPLGLDRYRNLGHALSDRYLVTSAGSLVRRRATLRCDAVIGWNLGSTVFQRRAGLMTLTATTAAGRQGYRIPDLGSAEALAVADEVTPDLLRQFRSGPPATSS
jgi:putative membrane protein